MMELGSNDGTVLEMLMRRGFRPIGFDPSAKSASRRESLVIKDYFSSEVAKQFVSGHRPVRLIFSRHTLEHTFDPVDFLRGVETALAPDGVAVIEIPYLRLQLMNNQFQSMTFQHVSFFTVSSMLKLIDNAGLRLFDLKFCGMDAGSMIIFVGKSGRKADLPGSLEGVLELEKALGLDRSAGYDAFFHHVQRQQTQVKEYLGKPRPQRHPGRCLRGGQ